MKPYFIWDYDLTEKDVKKILKDGNEFSRIWLISRILESAKYEDVWKYVKLDEVLQIFPRLKLKKPIKNAWLNAFKAWGVNNNINDNYHTITK
ncbi:hypothetical protein A2767_05550 [Candidatus Roizmanbacteria bacterium RIFCSPHIGHO2_01_FULL_35_10]|uniref:Uncharacterized protein n=1 Tax=Candidatus Roizmanbacteria bacterium RIFCSPLOWO2_01_FULL_35_13 TaxID=1802055 RepID=A0A1F7IBM7_9BACT|nr:MAG: hypothetical protein A2767_05550 [Candidatus Roizmanbacteria bacterium RIFCSPHIGHO2_01_FULL_35_10]OGK40757.1 MAG: hypothetical protein A3A74_04020 [Candidatus Roizmanbacteria bacterium RIFCSPLOWO2_01_FULL_35_13]